MMNDKALTATLVCLYVDQIDWSEHTEAIGPLAAKIMLNDLYALRNETGLETSEILDGWFREEIRQIVRLRALDLVSAKQAKELFEKCWDDRRSVIDIIVHDGILDEAEGDELQAMVAGIVANHPDVVEQIKSGKDRAIGFLVGQVMKQAKGRANPQQAPEMIRNSIG